MEGTARGTAVGRGMQAGAPYGLAAAFLALYLRTLCPTVYLGDSGEISTAIATGGVPHPPGYPLFSILGRMALVMIPWGEPAFRIGCVVAAAAAGAVAVLYLLARELGCSPWAAAAGAGMYGGSYSFWSQSTRVEVYSLHVLLSAVTLLAALRYRRTGSGWAMAAMVLAGSLGLAHHLTIVLLGPALLLLCGRRLWTDTGRARRLGLLAALLPVGPALYLFLLVWARSGPLQAWGHPVTLPLLWNHASAHIFRIFLEAPDGATLNRTVKQAWALFRDNFPGPLFCLPLLGAGLLWRRDRTIAAGLILGILAVGIYDLFYQIDDIACYYLTAWLIAAALGAAALDAISRRIPRPRTSSLTAAVAFCLLVGVPLLRNGRACDLSQATWMREFARHKLEAAEPGSVLIVQGDDDTNPIWYVHDVLRVRPDVLPIDRAQIGGRTWGLYDYDPSLWYLYRLRRQGIPAPLSVPEDPAARTELGHDGYLVRLLDHELRDRPLCTTFSAPGTRLARWLAARYIPVPVGVLLRFHRKSDPVDLAALLRENERLWSQIELPDLSAIRTDQEIAPGYVVGHYALMLSNFGGLYEKAGERTRAEAIYQQATGWATGNHAATAALPGTRGAPSRPPRLSAGFRPAGPG